MRVPDSGLRSGSHAADTGQDNWARAYKASMTFFGDPVTGRPTRRNPDVVRAAAKDLVRDLASNCDEFFAHESDEATLVRDMCEIGSWPTDGYEIAKNLEGRGWPITAAVVEVLDGWWSCLSTAEDRAHAQWAHENGVEPVFEGVVRARHEGTLGWAHTDERNRAQARVLFVADAEIPRFLRDERLMGGRVLPIEDVEVDPTHVFDPQVAFAP